VKIAAASRDERQPSSYCRCSDKAAVSAGRDSHGDKEQACAIRSSRRFAKDHSPCTPGLLKAAARQRLAAGQGVLELGRDTGAPGGPLPIISSGGGEA
jgi:hypothetical protein